MMKLFGKDPERDRETLFLTLALEFGAPPPYAVIQRKLLLAEVWEALGRAGSPITTMTAKEAAFDLSTALRFRDLAKQCGVPCETNDHFRTLYKQYEAWYEKHHPDVHGR